MFPGPGAVPITNEAGELLGWDNPSDDDFEPTEEDERRADAHAAWVEAAKAEEAEGYAEEVFSNVEDEETAHRLINAFSEWRVQKDQIELDIDQAFDNWVEWIERKR